METEGEINLYDIPVNALRTPARQIIVHGLNKKKVLPTKEELPRDWRGLRHLTGLPDPTGESPTNQLITALETDASSSLGQLEEFLQKLDRWDIVDDIYTLIRDDASVFLQKMRNLACTTNYEDESELHNAVLTDIDVARLEQRLGLLMYDALVLYADVDEDRIFANEIKNTLKNDGFKVCLKDDLLAGISFEHHGIMKLISERCRRVIVIISSNFMNSNANRFFVLFAQAVSISDDRRIIIPIIFGEGYINIPIEIKTISKLDYGKSVQEASNGFDFWNKLRGSINAPTIRNAAIEGPDNRPVRIQEINSSMEMLRSEDRAVDKWNSSENLKKMNEISYSLTNCSQSSSLLSVFRTHSSDISNPSKNKPKLKLPKKIKKLLKLEKIKPITS